MGVSTWARAFGEPLLEEVIVTAVANKDYKPSFWFLFLFLSDGGPIIYKSQHNGMLSSSNHVYVMISTSIKLAINNHKMKIQLLLSLMTLGFALGEPIPKTGSLAKADRRQQPQRYLRHVS